MSIQIISKSEGKSKINGKGDVFIFIISKSEGKSKKIMYRKLDVFEKYYSKMCKKQWKIDNGQ